MRSLSFCLRTVPAIAIVGTLACGPGSAGSGTAGTGGGAVGGQAGSSTGGGNGGDAAGGSGVGGTDTGAAGTGGSAGSTGGSAGSSATGAAGTGGDGGGTAGTGAAGTAGGAAGTAGGRGGAPGGRGGTTGGAGATAGRGGGAGGTAGASGGRGGTTGSGTGGQLATCVGSAYDAASPPQVLALTGSLGAHDPAALVVNNTIYLFATGLSAKTSTNLTSWQSASNPLNPRPAWVAQNVPGATNLWAPDISFFGGTYHLYYAASTFGSNKSCIGHATKADIATGSWADQGTVICSNMGTSDNWNAIDANIVIDDSGVPWMAFGSFWSGLKIVKLDATTGARADTAAPVGIANGANSRGSLEGAWIFKNCGYYYLFSSWGACCDGAYDYNIRVGRSTSVTGPYVDKNGTSLMMGGGTLLVQGNSTVHAPGHNAVITYNNKTYNLYHALNASNGNAQLHIAEIAWDAAGWPVSGGP